MSTRFAEAYWAPWTGLLVGPIAWAAHHQIGSDIVYLRCTPADAPVGAALGAFCFIASAAAAWLSWTSRKTGQASEHAVEMRRFVAWMGAAAGGLFALAIAFQTAATLLVTPCAP